MPGKSRTRRNTNPKVRINTKRKVRRNTNRKVRRNTNRKVSRNTNRKVRRNTNRKVRRNTYRKGGGGGKQLSKLNNLHKMGGWPGQWFWNATNGWVRSDARRWNRNRNRVDVTVSDRERARMDAEHESRDHDRLLTARAEQEMKNVRDHLNDLLNDGSADKPQEYFTLMDRVDRGESIEEIMYNDMEKAMRLVLGNSIPSYFPPIIEHHYQLGETLGKISSTRVPGTSSSGTDTPTSSGTDTPTSSGSNTPSSSGSYP